MLADVLRELTCPPSAYRGAPFWAWNGRLDPRELRRQVRLMHAMGLGGFFMHSRQCLATPYLSREWMDCVAACVAEARALGMNAWLYDEDRWPSGAAGGLVTRDPRWRQRFLHMTTLAHPRRLRWGKDTLAAFAAWGLGERLEGFSRLPRGARPGRLERGRRVLVFRVVLGRCEDWFNGATYLDTMNARAVREFIRVTHQAYARRFGEDFGRTIPGIFTDEPHYGSHGARLAGTLRARSAQDVIPWTDALPRVFRRRYGYNLLDHLPELFFAVGGRKVSPVRWHYHDCLTHLFVEAFARQISEWCRRHGLADTGHVLAEQTLAFQANYVGSAMRFYEPMQAPGMDLLGATSREYDTAKQVSSVARQFGRRWRLSETYGCTGWEYPLAGHKAQGDWQAALGINLRCQHLAWYTMEGEAKRDYPAAISYQSPWWSTYRRVEDYFARVNVLISRGQEVRDLLVIHPVESAWTLLYVGHDPADRQKLEEGFWQLRDELLGEHVDFDYGDEDILARRGRVVRGEGRAVLAVGRARYEAAIVPPMLTIRSSTVALLRRFRSAGGCVVFAGEAPAHVDAQPSSAALELAASCTRAPRKGKALIRAVETRARRVSITDSAGRELRAVLYGLREDGDAWYLFLCNTGQDVCGKQIDDLPLRQRTLAFDDVTVRVFCHGRGKPLEVDCDSGKLFAADGRATQVGWTLRTHLPALGSRLFVLPKKPPRRAYPRRPAMKEVARVPLRGAWDVQLSDPNCLVLDRARWRMDHGPWQGPQEILRIDTAVRRAAGIPRIAWNMRQPWAQPVPPRPPRASVSLEYAFAVRVLPAGAVHLAIERPQLYRIALNGQPVCGDADCGWWVDRSLRLLPLDGAVLHLGRNVLTLACELSQFHPGLEIVYLLGDFGTAAVGRRVSIVAPPRRLKPGDWTAQGLAFYAGHVSYLRRIRPALRARQRLFVRVGAYEGVGVRVLVDGREAGIIAWPPNEVDITDCLGAREVTLAIEVLGHRRNSHGPLHLVGQPASVWPGSWRTKEGQWTDGYRLVPCGLMTPPHLVIKQ
ncbi:MAG: hypothetical protein MUP47_07430 [Phycisphaerae bacterium]|nr:hypothetical protein [Phycisphaerae bacterium]